MCLTSGTDELEVCSCAIRKRVSQMRVAGIALIVLACIGRDLHGQSLTVFVRDSAGRVVATTRTALGGLAQLDHLAPGSYRVMARRFGFLPRFSSFVRIGRADTVAVKITLDRMHLILEEVNVVSNAGPDEPHLPTAVADHTTRLRDARRRTA